VGIFELLGISRNTDSFQSKVSRFGETATVKRIVVELSSLEPTLATFIAAFAFVLNRVAHADSNISQAETEKIQDIVWKRGHLSPEQARLVVKIAKNQAELFGGTENFLVTREFRETSTMEQRLELLDCLFAVATADGKISGTEETQIGQIATELSISQPTYATALSAHSEHRSVLRSLRKN